MTGMPAKDVSSVSFEPLGKLGVTAIVLNLVQAVGALGGGLALMLGPHGEILPLPVAALRGSPFANYFVPGLVLFVVLGIGPLLVAALGFRRHRFAPLLTVGVGAALLIWMVVEIAVIGYSNHPPLQPIYLALSIAISVIGGLWLSQTGFPFQPPSRKNARSDGTSPLHNSQ